MTTEKAKKIAGEFYLADDPELIAERQRASQLIRLFNSTTETELEQRQQLLGELLGAVGENPEINPPFYCEYGYNIYLGNQIYLNHGCVILDCGTVHLGNQVLCGPYVQIYTVNHPINPGMRLTGREQAKPVAIADNVWIGGGSIICPGVTIGAHTTIGAGSVVTKDIPPYVLAVGNPCRVIRELPSD